MQKIKLVVDEKGNVEYDLVEGFSGASCEVKAKNIEVLIAGAGNTETKYKPEYYQEDKEEWVNVFTNR